MIVCPLHWYFCATHLVEVEAEMLRRGPPRLRGYMDEEAGVFLLREGTHRIRAAHHLGIVPVLVSIPWWRARARLVNARVAAATRGLEFAEVTLLTTSVRSVPVTESRGESDRGGEPFCCARLQPWPRA